MIMLDSMWKKDRHKESWATDVKANRSDIKKIFMQYSNGGRGPDG